MLSQCMSVASALIKEVVMTSIWRCPLSRDIFGRPLNHIQSTSCPFLYAMYTSVHMGRLLSIGYVYTYIHYTVHTHISVYKHSISE